MKRYLLTFALAATVALGVLPLRADDTNAMAGMAMTNAPAAAAPAAVPASTDPKTDPAGTATGSSADAQDAAGNHFVVSEPTALSGDDLKDTNKVAAYTDAKKAFDDYTAQAKLEPLAVKLADSVGHNRVAINFMWTLVTGFLVMFMQAGFALVETGLCRAKNAGPHHGHEFHDLSHGHARILRLRLRLHVRRHWAAIGTMGGYGGLNHEITWTLFGHPFGILGWKGFLLQGAGYDTAAFALFLFQMVFMDTTATIPTGGAAERWKFSAFMIYGCCIGTIMYPLFGNWVWGGGWLAQLGANFGLGHGHVDFAGSSVVHMQGGVICLIFCWLIGAAPRQIRQERANSFIRSRRTASRWSCSARSSWPSAGSDSIRARPWPAPTCASPWSPSTPCWPPPPARSPPRSGCGGSRPRSPIRP